MTDHIYGRDNMITRTDRPNIFIKELTIYIDYLKNKLEEVKAAMTTKEEKYLQTFTANLNEGISYYRALFQNLKNNFQEIKDEVIMALDNGEKTLNLISLEIENVALKNLKQSIAV